MRTTAKDYQLHDQRRLAFEALERHTLLSVATINWGTTEQTIAGFGASSAWMGGTLSGSQQQLLWSSTNGAGLSILRSQINETSPVTAPTSGEASIMQEAQAMGATDFSTPWSPPANFKTNDNIDNGGTLLSGTDPSTGVSYYQDYANWLAAYVENMKSTYGVTLYGVSMQNEPDWVAGYDSCVWTAAEFDTVLFQYLEPTFTADGLSSTKIILPEETHWDSLNLVSTVLSDSRLSSYSNIIFADHTYGDDSNNSPIPPTIDGYPIWETEHTGDNPDIGVQAALDLAENIYHVVGQNQASAYNYWWINAGGGAGLLGGNWQSTYNFTAMENFSKFIRPGWVQVGESDDSDGLQICAFKNPTTGNFATVLINETSSPIAETINLSGAYSPVLTPWVTSATLNCAQQQSLPASGNGGSYVYTVPAQSIVTLTGTATTTPVAAATVGLLATATSTSSIALSWTNNLGTSDTYTIERSTNGTTWTTLASGLSSSTYIYTETGLAANTQYFYQVVASDGTASNVAAVMTQPPAPSNLTASYDASNQDVTLTWTGNGSSATDYAVGVSTNGGNTWTTQTAGLSSGTMSYTDTNAPDLATAIYRVWAIYGANSSAPTNTVTVTTTVLKAPTGLTATLDSNGTSVDLTWTDATWTNATVSIERSTNGTTWTVIGSVAHGVQAYTDSTTSEGGTYFYQVCNIYNSTDSAFDASSPASITVPPNAPTHVEVEFSSLPTLMALVVWDNNSAADTAYEVERSSDGGNTWTTLTNTLPAGSTSYTDTTVTSGQAYEYRVAALMDSVSSTSITTLPETASALPSPYAHGDIGDPSTLGLAGSASYNSSTATYTLNGSGADIWNTSDGFQFAYTTMTGNGQIGACTTSVSDTNAWAKAGLMFRDDDAADAAFADVVATPGSGVSFQWRTTDGGNPGGAQVAGVAAPVWLRLTRAGNQFSGYYSSNDATWTQIGGSVTITMGTTALVGMVTCAHDSTQVATATFTNVALTGTVAQAPTVATAAAASPSPVTGTTTHLSVLGSDGLGAGDLMYTWAATTLPTSAAAPTFSSNGATAADDTTATFSQAGTYGFTVTIVDLAGLLITSKVTVSVNQVVSSIVVSPSGATVAPHGQKQFAATAYDQFANMATQPSFAWSSSNPSLGSISASGLFTAGALQGMTTITATSGSVRASAVADVTTLPAPLAWYRFADRSGTAAADSSGNGLTGTLVNGPTWTTSGVNGGGVALNGTSQYVTVPALNLDSNTVTISAWIYSNAAQSDNSGIVFYRNGSGTASGLSIHSTGALTYNWNDNYSAWSWSSGLTVPNGVWTYVALVVSPSNATLYVQPAGSAMQSAVNSVSNAAQPFSGVSDIGQDPLGGRYFNGSVDDVRIYNAGFTAAQVTQLYDSYWPPTVATAAAANPATVTGTKATLSAAGASSVFSSSSLTYTWSTIGIPPAPVTFSANGANAASSTVATFSTLGTYTLGVTIADPDGQFVTSSVNVTVNQTVTSIAVSPSPASLNASSTQQFAATALDQFGAAMATQPTFTWSTATGSSSVGSISASGLLTTSNTSATGPVTATSGTISGSSTVTVTEHAPTVATAAAASPGTVTGTTTALSVLGTDVDAGASLSYLWSATALPAGAASPIYSVNGIAAADNTTATFSKAGAYTLTVTITNPGGMTATSSVSVTVNQTYSSLSLSPTAPSITGGSTQQFTVTARDQFSQALASQPAITWILVSGPGTLTSGGLYTPPYASGSATVRAASGSYTATATVTFSSEAQWNAVTNSSWTTSGNWKDASTGAALAAPGVRGLTGDTVLFTSATGSVARLDGANPTLAAITFNNATTSYTIAQGAGGSITLQGSAGATVSALAGSDTIAAPLQFASNTTFNAAAASTLTITGSIDGSGTLTMTGKGKLLLNAANTFSGGLVVQSGTLIVTSAAALPAGSSLTLGNASYFSAPTVTAVSPILATSSVIAAAGAVAAQTRPLAAAASVPEVHDRIFASGEDFGPVRASMMQKQRGLVPFSTSARSGEASWYTDGFDSVMARPRLGPLFLK